ncbi:hypothetical protein ACA910_016914 [Epithemia clementina (nom. ined.)]
MFRNTNKVKKKKASIRRSLSVDEEVDSKQSISIDDEGEATAVSSLKKRQHLNKAKTNKPAIRTTTTTATNASDSTNSRTTIAQGGGSKASRKRRRIGFSGASLVGDHHHDSNEDDDNGATKTATSSLYDSEALAQLKAEQAEMNSKAVLQKKEKEGNSQLLASATVPTRENPPQFADNRHSDTIPMELNKAGTRTKVNENTREEEFISLNSNGPGKHRQRTDDTFIDHNTVLAGDEALEAAMNLDGFDHDQSESKRNVLRKEDNVYDEADDDIATVEATSLWQDQIAQRAGIRKTAADTWPQVHQTRRQPQALDNTISIAEMRQQFIDAQKTLRMQIEDTETTLARRQVEIQQTKDQEVKKHTCVVEECGQALEFYQTWRARVVPYVAALRELSDKISSVQTAIATLTERQVKLVQDRRQWHVDDCLAELHEAKLLEVVLGRPPDPGLLVNETNEAVVAQEEVDEFGRKVQSQRLLQRERRTQLRTTIRQQQKERREKQLNVQDTTQPLDDNIEGDDLECWMTNDEIESFGQQRAALREAFKFAMAQVQEDYTSLSHLINLFTEWFYHNTEQYRDCFAGLSLADLASVLVRAEICASLLDETTTIPNNTNSTTQTSWIVSLQQAVSSSLLDGDAMDRLLETTVVPFVVDFMQKDRLDLESPVQTQRLIQIWQNVVTHLLISTDVETGRSSKTQWKTTVGQSILDCWKFCLNGVALPALKDDRVDDDANDTALPDVDQGSHLVRVERIVGQVKEFKAILEAVGSFDALGALVVNFLVNTFLPFLSSLNASRSKNGVQPSQVTAIFSSIWKLLESTTWLKQPDLFVQATTLQAASEIFLDEDDAKVT